MLQCNNFQRLRLRFALPPPQLFFQGFELLAQLFDIAVAMVFRGLGLRLRRARLWAWRAAPRADVGEHPR